nr:MAG: hypothetical protein DIU78_17105 [Pseudomonadota bacterium]
MTRHRRHLLRERLTRRDLLIGASGIAVALPLLPSLTARAQENVAPKRLVLMYTPNGVVPDAWKPTNVTSETSFDLGPTHSALAPFKDRLIFFSGVDLKIALRPNSPGGLHQRGIGGLFTGHELQEGTEFVDGCGQRAGWANGISVDQEVARHIGNATLLPSLELGVHALDNDVQGRIAYAGPGQPLPPMNDPLSVYDRLFANVMRGTSASDQLRVRRASVLDAVKEQFATLGTRLGAADRQKLEAHLTLVRDMERRLTIRGAPDECSAPSTPPTLDPASEEDMPFIADLEIDLLAIAFACDLTRVASFQISTSLNRVRYPWLNSMGEGHLLSHAGPSNVESRAELMARDAWHSGRLARLLQRLSEIPEGDGTALDNTLVLWGNEVAVGNTHAHTDMPFLLAGGTWYFRTGRALTYSAASHNDLLVSVLNAMGVPATTFGNPEVCSGPLSGLV